MDKYNKSEEYINVTLTIVEFGVAYFAGLRLAHEAFDWTEPNNTVFLLDSLVTALNAYQPITMKPAKAAAVHLLRRR